MLLQAAAEAMEALRGGFVRYGDYLIKARRFKAGWQAWAWGPPPRSGTGKRKLIGTGRRYYDTKDEAVSAAMRRIDRSR